MSGDPAEPYRALYFGLLWGAASWKTSAAFRYSELRIFDQEEGGG